MARLFKLAQGARRPLRVEKQQFSKKERKSEMAVPVRPNGLDDDDDDDNIEGLNALFEEEGLEIDPEDADVPLYIRNIDDAFELYDFDAFRQALDNVPGGVDEQLYYGYTALHMACLHGHVEFAELLLQRGANLLIKDEDGHIPLHYACERDFVEMTVLLLNKARDREQMREMIETVDPVGNTPLHWAAKHGNIIIFGVLLAYGASPTKINSKGETPVEMPYNPDFRRQLEVEVASADSYEQLREL